MDKYLDRERYLRQIQFAPLGESGQEKLLRSTVLLVGCGGLGTAVANYLVRSGVGSLKIIDRDRVEISNLNRQVLFDEEDVFLKRPKAFAASVKLKKINAMVNIRPFVAELNGTNITELLQDVDLVIDGTDNMETRFLLNDACLKHNLPWIYGGVAGGSGMTMNIIPGGPCLRCILQELPPSGTVDTGATVGIINPIPAVIAAIQSTEAMKILINSSLISKDLLYIDLWGNTVNRIRCRQVPDCSTCVKREFTFLARSANTN